MTGESNVPTALRTQPDGSGTLISENLALGKAHVLGRIEASPTGQHPFHHTFVEEVFPAVFYDSIHAHMLAFKYSDKVQGRHQDNPAFLNQRYNLFESRDDVVECIRAIFSDPDVKQAILKKFYVTPSRTLADGLSIHEEFEYVFTKGGRYQNIHIDIPPKFVSLVFYIPEHPVQPADEERNATILYDKSLAPHYKARFKANSVCIFVPHFYSYHGFSSTIDRDVLVMFYVNENELRQWRAIRQEEKDEPPFVALIDAIERKVRMYPLIEFADGESRLQAERAACLVNAPQGRILLGKEGKALPGPTRR